MGILNIHRGYFNLLYQAVQYYPNFDIKVTEMFESGLKQWEVVVKHAVESGEIKALVMLTKWHRHLGIYIQDCHLKIAFI